MTEPIDLDYQREMVKRLLAKTQHSLDMVSVCYRAGLVDDVAEALAADLGARGITDMSDEWVQRSAQLIRLGESPTMPTIEDLWETS